MWRLQNGRYIDSVSEQILEWSYDYNGATAFFTEALMSCVWKID